MTHLSTRFTLADLTRSPTAMRRGIDNTPPQAAVEELRSLCVRVLEPLVDEVGPIQINSGYRSPTLNKSIGGSVRSQHSLGQAVDIEHPLLSTADLARKIISLGLPFDQLILEFASTSDPRAGWVHVSHRVANRGEVLQINRVGDRVVTSRWDP